MKSPSRPRVLGRVSPCALRASRLGRMSSCALRASRVGLLIAALLLAALPSAPHAAADDPPRDVWSATLTDDPPRRAWSALLGTARARTALLGQRGSDEAERIAAAELLGDITTGTAPEATLLAALEREQAPRVREALLVALGRRARPESVPALVVVHRRGDPVERGLALRALAGIDGDVALRELVLHLAAPDSMEEAVPALVRSGARVVPAVLRALREPPTSGASAAALGALGDARATAPLVALLRSEREADRVAALEALGALGDSRAADAIAAWLDDAAPRVVLAALHALERLGDASHGAALLARTQTGSVEQRHAALSALVAVDPPAGAAALAAIFAGATPELLGAARAILVDAREPALATLLEQRLSRDAQPDVLAGALAALDGGAGITPLLRIASTAPAPLRAAVVGALAVALRSWRDELSAGALATAHEVLAAACRTFPSSEALVLRGLARDARIVPALRVALTRPTSPAPERAAAALAAETLGAEELAPAVLDALLREQDPEAFRRLADAARSLRAAASIAPLLARLHDPETAPEALLLAATSLARASAEERRAFAVAARASLRSPDERLRSAAPRALALAGDRRAARALLAAVRSASTVYGRAAAAPSLAVAAARALAALPAPAALAGALAAESRAAADPRVRAALLDAIAAAEDGRARPLDTRGTEVLYVRLVLSGGARSDGVGVDLRLDDGRVLRRRTLPSGALFVPDLASGVADVTLRTETALAAPPSVVGPPRP